MKKYFEEMNYLRGLGIFLVVVGHSFPDKSGSEFGGQVIYEFIHKLIYSFHMPLFFFISGFFAIKIFEIKSIEEYKNFIKGKVRRLIVPYLSISLLAAPIKLVLSKFSERSISVETIIYSIFINPWESPIIFFWFIYTLFIIFLISPIIINIPSKIIFPLLLIINLLPIKFANIFTLNEIKYNFLFFYIGIIFYGYYDKYRVRNDKGVISIISLCVLLISIGFNVKYKIILLLKPILGIIICLNLVHKIKCIKLINILNLLGKYSFDIFLFSWFFQTGTRVVLLQILDVNYNLVVILSIIVGFMPILLSKFILEKFKILTKVFLGRK